MYWRMTPAVQYKLQTSIPNRQCLQVRSLSALLMASSTPIWSRCTFQLHCFWVDHCRLLLETSTGQGFEWALEKPSFAQIIKAPWFIVMSRMTAEQQEAMNLVSTKLRFSWKHLFFSPASAPFYFPSKCICNHRCKSRKEWAPQRFLFPPHWTLYTDLIFLWQLSDYPSSSWIIHSQLKIYSWQ